MGYISFHAYFAFAFVLLCVCNGMPPKQTRTPTSRFTAQEQKLLLNMLDSFAKTGPYNPSIWKEIEKVFKEKRGKVEGFSAPRTTVSLRHHFLYIVKSDQIKLPESVREFHEQMKKTAISPQEQDFINQQLLGSEDDGLPILGEKRWKNIQKRHEAKRKAGERGFENKRAFSTFRTHFRNVMIPKNLVLDAVMQKFPEYFENKRGTTSVGGTNQADNAVIQYTNQEHELMVKMLEPMARSGEYKHSVWKDIEKAFEEKRNSHAYGFVVPRTLYSIRKHFVRSVVTEKSDALWNLYEQMQMIGISDQERNFINNELARTDLPISSPRIHNRWKTMQEKHDAYREAGIPGFTNKRSWATLRNHYYRVMKPQNLVGKEIFPIDFGNNQNALSAEEEQQLDIGSGESMELSSNEDEDYDAWIDEYGVDDLMVLDSNEDNSLEIGD